MTKLLSHEFFLENQFEVIMQQDRRPNSKTALMKIQDESHSNTIVYHYDFECHTPRSVTEELVSTEYSVHVHCMPYIYITLYIYTFIYMYVSTHFLHVRVSLFTAP